MEATEHTAGIIPLQLKAFRMTELQFRNRTPKSGFPLKQEMRYQLRFLPGKDPRPGNRLMGLCEGVLSLRLFDAASAQLAKDDPSAAGEGFDLSLTFTGLFAYDPTRRQTGENGPTADASPGAAPSAGSQGESAVPTDGTGADTAAGTRASAEEIFREQLHRLTCATLYPHAAAMVATLTAQAGLPPLILTQPESSGGVYLIERNRKKDGDGK